VVELVGAKVRGSQIQDLEPRRSHLRRERDENEAGQGGCVRGRNPLAES